MKKNILVLLLILAGACTPSKPLPATATVAPQMTSSPAAVGQPASTITPPGKRTTATPGPTSTSLIYHEYDPEEWELIPGSEDRADFFGSFLDPNHWLWKAEKENLIYYDGKDWGKIALNESPDADLYYIPFIGCMNPDGAFWLIRGDRGKADLVRYKDKQKVSFTIPGATRANYLALADDRNHGVWVLVSKNLYHFDGLNWQEYPLPFGDRLGWSSHIETDSKGNLWLISDSTGFARFNGKTWREYEARVYWPKPRDNPDGLIRFAPGPDGSFWVAAGQRADHTTIYRFYPDGKVDKIKAPFLGKDFGFAMRLYVDSRNNLWLMVLKESDSAMPPLVYWDGAHWNTFTHLPFKSWVRPVFGAIWQQEDRMLIQTEMGWYWYTPQK